MFDVHWFNPVFDSQRVFRLILDCMSRPGKVALLPAGCNEEGHRSLAAVALTLLDGEATFAVLDRESGHLIKFINFMAGGRMVEAAQADYVFLDGNEEPAQLKDVLRGSLLFPEQGATIICRVQAIRSNALGNGVPLVLQGPGVPGTRTIRVEGICREVLAGLGRLNNEYPLGVDTILVSSRGEMSCLPRSVQLTWH